MYPNEYDIKILALYLRDYSAEYYLREISRLAEISLKATQNGLQSLEKQKIILSRTHGKNKYFRLNRENIQAKLQLIQAEIYRTNLFFDKYPALKIFAKELKTNTTKIIFGSFAKFSADRNSDLDLLVISKRKESLPEHLLPNRLQQINLSEKSFFKALKSSEPLINEIKKDHIILNNHSFYVDLMWENEKRY